MKPNALASTQPPSPLSMTGFGSAEGFIGPHQYRVEIRSVNHRYLDLKIRLPREFQAFDAQVRALIQSQIARGALEFKLERMASENSVSSSPAFHVNLALARQVHDALELIRRELKLESPVTVRDVAQFNQVLQSGDTEPAPSAPDALELWENQLAPLVRRAVHDLIAMKQREGESLSNILKAGMDEINEVIREIRRLRQVSETEIRLKISEKIKKILEAYPLDSAASQTLLETRLAQELAFVLDRTDIREELDRFEGHIQHFRKTLAEENQLGRKLEFILQELGREINTLGNKAQDLGISQWVVSTKVKLEQLREQVLNLA